MRTNAVAIVALSCDIHPVTCVCHSVTIILKVINVTEKRVKPVRVHIIRSKCINVPRNDHDKINNVFYAKCIDRLLERSIVILAKNVVEKVLESCLALGSGENHGVGDGRLNLNLLLEIT